MSDRFIYISVYPAYVHNLMTQASEHNHNRKCTEQGGVHGTLAQGTTIQSRQCIHLTPQSIIPASSDAINSRT
jgi:chorismate synthase